MSLTLRRFPFRELYRSCIIQVNSRVNDVPGGFHLNLFKEFLRVYSQCIDSEVVDQLESSEQNSMQISL